MDDKIEPFPWLPVIKRRFLESLHGGYEIGMLEWLQRNIAEEIRKVELNHDLKIAKLLLKGIKYLYYHFCTIWNSRNQASPYNFEFSSHMKNTWVHILSSIIKICVLLSRGKKNSKWTNRALNAIAIFPGEKNLIYDALLFVHSLRNKYKPAYGGILKSLLMDMPLFIPAIIDDPAEFLKVYLLVRRLKLMIKDRAEKFALQMKASKIMAPLSLWRWLLAHDFIVPWTKSRIVWVNLWTNICKKLVENESQVEIVETLRKVLLPGLCTERKAEQQRSCVKNWSRRREYVSVTCADQLSSEDDEEIASSEAENKIKTRINYVTMTFSAQVSSEYKEITAIERKNKSGKRKTCVSVPRTDQILSEDDKEEITVNETKVKSKKLKKRRNSPQEDGEKDINVSRPDMQKPVGKLENVVGSEENAFHTINHTSAIGTFDNAKLVTEKKNRKRKKSMHLEENLLYKTGQADLTFQECSSKSVKLAAEKIKRQRKQKLGKIAEKKLNKANQSIDKDSCLLEDSTENIEQRAGGRKRPEMKSKKKQEDCIGNSDSECEPKGKKRRQREKIVAEKILDSVNVASCDNSLLKDNSQTTKITKSRKQRSKQLGSNSKETELNAINSESDAEDLPVIVDEIHVNKPVPNERECLSKSRIVDSDSSASDDDEPVILREVKHCLDFGLNSSHRKENKDRKNGLKSNPGAEAKIMAQNIFIIDSKPSPCFSESGANQIAYDTIYNAEQKDASYEKPENISNNGEDLNSSATLADLQDEDLPAESNSRLKITDYRRTSEETEGSCASSSGPFGNDQQDPVSEKEMRASSNNQTSINMNSQDGKFEDGDNVISSTMGKHWGDTAQTDKESSRDSAVQTEDLGYSPNQTSDLIENCINCRNIKSGPTSKKLTDGNEKIPIQTDFEKETTQRTNISQAVLPVLESHGSPVLGHSSLNGDSSAQEIEMRKDEHPSTETDEFVSVADNIVDFQETMHIHTETDEFVSVADKIVDFQETMHIHTETTENNVIVKSELPFKNSALSSEVKKEEITQENRVSESSIDSPLSNTSCLKTGEISSQSVAETASSDSVNISSPERKKIENNCSIEIKGEVPLENSASSFLENKMSLQLIPMDTNKSSQESIKGERLTSDSSLPDELVSVIDKVDFQETNHIVTETTENNANVIVKSELPFKNSALSSEVKREEITQENRVSESSIDSPLSNTSCLKTGEISSQSVAETASSDSVNISSPERQNLEKIENNCSIEIKSEAPLENSVSSLLENKISLQLIPININNSSQETVIKEERLTSDSSLPDKSKSEVDSDSNSSFEIDNLEVKKERDNTSIDMQRPSQNNSIHDQPKYQVTGLFFDVKSPISKTEGSLLEDSERSPNHQNLDGEAKNSKVETPNTSAAKVMIESVLRLAEFVGCRKESVRQNINNGDLTSTLNSLSVKHLSKLTSSAANEKPAECLSFFDISAENVGSLNESQSFACQTPEISEFLQYRDLSNDQDDNRSEDTLSESKSILKTDVSEYPSDTSNDTEGEESNSSPIDCNSPDAVPDASNFKNNYDTYVVKTECSWDDAITRQRFCQEDDGECDTKSSQDNQTNIYDTYVVKTECSWDNAITRKQLCEEDNEHDTRSSQDNQTDISTKIFQLKGWMLNPVVNLGERCDNSFIGMNSNVSADSVSIPTNSSVLPDIKTEDEEINATRPFKSNQASLTVDQLLTPVNERAIKLEAIEQSTSDTGIHDEIEKVNRVVKMEIQPGHKDVKELSLVTDQELTVSDEDQESVELTSKKDLSEDHKATGYDKGLKLTICDKDQLSIEPTRETDLSKDQKITVCDKGQELSETREERELSLSMKLRKRPVTAVQTEKSMPDKGSKVLNQDTPATLCMNLRSRNPSSSSQGKSASADEDSSVASQDIPATPYMNVRSRNHSTLSSQGKSAPANEDSSVLNQDTPATRCMNLRSRNSSLSSSQGKSAPADEDSSVLNQNIPATRYMNLRSRNPSASSIQEVMKRRSQTVTKRSSKRLKKEVNLNLGFDFSELSLNSPKALRSTPNGSSNKNSSEVVRDKSPTSDQGNPCRRLTRASVISSTVDTRINEQDTDPEGYNLRSRKSVIMPGKLKL